MLILLLLLLHNPVFKLNQFTFLAHLYQVNLNLLRLMTPPLLVINSKHIKIWKKNSEQAPIKLGWRSGQSARLPPMWPGFDSRTRRHMWVEFVVGSRPCSERFFSGYSGFPLSSKTNISKFQFDLESVPISAVRAKYIDT